MTQKVRTDLAGHSEQGPRNYNEDRHLVIQLDLAGARHSLLAVADGLGGEGGGDLAAQVCTDELARSHVKLAKAFSNYCKYSPSEEADVETPVMENPLENLQEEVKAVIRKINFILAEKQLQTAPEQKTDGSKGLGMMSTLVALLTFEDRGLLFWLGDSRAYRFRDGWLHQLSSDHERDGRITRYVGPAAKKAPEFKEIDIVPGDVYILCSDGLSGYCQAEELEGMVRYSLARSHDPANLCLELTEFVEDTTKDNVTVAVQIHQPLSWPPSHGLAYSASELALPHIRNAFTESCFSQDWASRFDSTSLRNMEGGLTDHFYFPGQGICTCCGWPLRSQSKTECQNRRCGHEEKISGPFIEVSDGDRLVYKAIPIDLNQILEGACDAFFLIGDNRGIDASYNKEDMTIDLGELPSFTGEVLQFVIRNNQAPWIQSLHSQHLTQMLIPSQARWSFFNNHCLTTKGFFRGSVLRFKEAIIRFLCTEPAHEAGTR